MSSSLGFGFRRFGVLASTTATSLDVSFLAAPGDALTRR